MFFFATSFVAFDTAAGVVTGLLVQAARESGGTETLREAVSIIWTDPVVGAAPGTSPVLAVLGTLSWTIGSLAAAVAIRRARAGWLPVALIALSSSGLVVFRTHAWPGGPLSFGLLAAGAASLRWGQRRSAHLRDGAPARVSHQPT